MAEQDIYFFDYLNESRRPPLLNKGAFIDNSFANYKKQVSFDKRLAKLLGFNLYEDVLMNRGEFETRLINQGKIIKGFRLISLRFINNK